MCHENSEAEKGKVQHVPFKEVKIDECIKEV